MYAIDEESGEIAPNEQGNIPGLKALGNADLMVIATRFRNLPDEQMKEIDDYLRSGRPVIGMRTATHAFKVPKDSPYAHYSFNYHGDKQEWTQGFGRVVLGETWISHHGHHKHESTRGILAPEVKGHPILRGIESGDIWGPTDVYGVRFTTARRQYAVGARSGLGKYGSPFEAIGRRTKKRKKEHFKK